MIETKPPSGIDIPHGIITKLAWDSVSPILLSHSTELSQVALALLQEDTPVAAGDQDTAWRKVLPTQEDTLNNPLSEGFFL